MFLLQNVVTNLAIFSGILALLLMILLLIVSLKKGNKKKIISLIVLILLISPFSINSIESKMRIAHEARSIERSIEKSLREEDYILLEKQVDKETLASLIKKNPEKFKKDESIESKLDEETREAALERITNAIKTYKEHHAEEQKKKEEEPFGNDPMIYRNSEY